MLETKKSRRAFVNIIFDGALYIGIGVSIGTLLNSPIIGFMGVLMASMMKRCITLMHDWIEEGTDDVEKMWDDNLKKYNKIIVDQEDDGEI